MMTLELLAVIVVGGKDPAQRSRAEAPALQDRLKHSWPPGLLSCSALKQDDGSAGLDMLCLQSHVPCNPRRVNLLLLSCLQEGELHKLS